MAPNRPRRDSVVEAAAAELDAVTSPLLTKSSVPQELPTSISRPLSSENTIKYLAYGSNLSAETFLGRRGIKPLAQINVVVPSLRLVLDLPGLPYWEPRFANVGRRQHDESTPHEQVILSSLDGEYVDGDPLIGVVYEVTPEDYGNIRATEAGYDVAEVTCHTLPPTATTTTTDENAVQQEPFPETFKAITLIISPDKTRHSEGQASLRYLKLIRTGAAEHALPVNYQAYLSQLQEFKRTSRRQTFGGFLMAFAWMPALFGVMALRALFSDKDGGAPAWITSVMEIVFKSVWKSYDNGWKAVWGEGERTVEKEERKTLVDGQVGYGTV